VLQHTAVDAVLADVTFTGALPLLLQDAPRPPVVVCNVGPLTLSSADIPPFGMAWQPVPGVDYRPMTAVAHGVIMRGSQCRFNRALRRAGSPPAPVFISDWPRLADGVLQISVQEFEYPRSDLPASVEFVGPVLPGNTHGDSALPDWWADMSQARSVIHVTQGTFDNSDPEQLIGPTLEALADRDDLLVVVATGRTGSRLTCRVPDNARVADWLPYSALMPHLDVMVTNGGYGGVQYALSHGVPLVVAGETSDKAEVAARVDYTGVGIDLGTSTPTAEAIRCGVGRVLSDDRFRAAVQGMQRAIASTTPVDAIANALKRWA
jgi:UDP:flavonoid glycosyltransferase YjiC (YdhE family)